MNAFQHRRPLAAYLEQHNPELEESTSPWFYRAQGLILGIAVAALVLAVSTI